MASGAESGSVVAPAGITARQNASPRGLSGLTDSDQPPGCCVNKAWAARCPSPVRRHSGLT
ncbi:hypothetical protein QZQ41_12735 [Serratia marcescens]|uniref:hypothetical protein n=1 Tax=Serratia marcescens TaxID=615 RepID=UPI00274D2340|nr:hypothetical protein [Serratia marcescens]MDP8615466.1 hypothetical protein [Serratia marcescens]MDP8655459.1 hypothetical protein [Serratia marcescens]MDP8660421.1 hypothetical protein [Serratia marcescens]